MIPWVLIEVPVKIVMLPAGSPFYLPNDGIGTDVKAAAHHARLKVSMCEDTLSMASNILDGAVHVCQTSSSFHKQWNSQRVFSFLKTLIGQEAAPGAAVCLQIQYYVIHMRVIRWSTWSINYWV